jgi:DNA processing protein
MSRLLDNRTLRGAWEEILAGDHPVDPRRSLSKKARPEWPEVFSKRLDDCKAKVLIKGRPGFPLALEEQPDGPPILFCIGDPAVFDARARVAVVGTRSATRYGMEVATELGSGLAASNVTVVSGLAPGVDSAAHGGVLSLSDGAPPLAVVAPGVDIASPKSTSTLRDGVVAAGVVVSELPPGVHPQRWRFADRNRLLANLSHVVVVVECHRSGGALYSVLAARERGICVMAVPGSVFSSASSGTNALLADGVPPARDLEDVLTAVELAIVGEGKLTPPIWPRNGSMASQRGAPSKPPGGICARVFAVLEAEPESLESIVERLRVPIGQVAVALDQLQQLALADEESGWWRRRGRR